MYLSLRSYLIVCVFSIGLCTRVFGGIIIAGTDNPLSSSAQFTIQITFPGGFSETLSLSSGPFSIVRQQQQGLGDGTASSFIDTELRGLTFAGTSVNLGPLTVRVGADNGVQQGASLGQLRNVLTTTPGLPALVGPEEFVSGDSFFEVFFEVDAAGMTFYNRDPHVLSSAGISSLPPTGSVHLPAGEVGLFMRIGPNNQPTDPLIGTASGSHTINAVPEPASIVMLGLALLTATASRRRVAHCCEPI